MPEDPPAASHTPVDSAKLWERVDAVVDRWYAGEEPDAARALAADPELAADREIVIHLAFEEYSLRQEAGERVSSASFIARFPGFKQSIKRLISVDRFLDSIGGGARPRQPERWPKAGERLHQFQIVRELGRGGFARAYLALETSAGDRPVVLKVSATDPSEAHALGSHPHPHVVPLYSAPPTEGLSVVVMPYLGTETLDDVRASLWSEAGRGPRTGADLLAACRVDVKPGDPPMPDSAPGAIVPSARFAQAVAAIGAGLADALAFLHGKGLAHRDLKPSNVLLAPTGRPYLLDFNLSAQAQEGTAVAGTVPYMAPEQLAAFAGDGPVDYDRPAADVFALGVILYELLRGRHPYEPSDPNLEPEEVVREIRAAQAKGPSVDRRVPAIVIRCLAAVPGDRPKAEEVAAELRRLATPRPWRKQAILAAVGMMAILAVGAGVFLKGRPSGPYERGLTLIEKGEYGLAANEFMEAAVETRDGRAYSYAGYCYAERSDFVRAAECYDQAIAAGIADSVVLTNRADARYRNGKVAAALDDCNAAIAADPECLEARYLRAKVIIRLHEAAKNDAQLLLAIADLERVRVQRPKWADASRLAVKLYAMTAATNPAHRELGVAAVREAIARGVEPGSLERDFVIKKALSGHPHFQSALKTPLGLGAPTSPLPVRPRY